MLVFSNPALCHIYSTTHVVFSYTTGFLVSNLIFTKKKVTCVFNAMEPPPAGATPHGPCVRVLDDRQRAALFWSQVRNGIPTAWRRGSTNRPRRTRQADFFCPADFFPALFGRAIWFDQLCHHSSPPQTIVLILSLERHACGTPCFELLLLNLLKARKNSKHQGIPKFRSLFGVSCFWCIPQLSSKVLWMFVFFLFDFAWIRGNFYLPWRRNWSCETQAIPPQVRCCTAFIYARYSTPEFCCASDPTASDEFLLQPHPAQVLTWPLCSRQRAFSCHLKECETSFSTQPQTFFLPSHCGKNNSEGGNQFRCILSFLFDVICTVAATIYRLKDPNLSLASWSHFPPIDFLVCIPLVFPEHINIYIVISDQLGRWSSLYFPC